MGIFSNKSKSSKSTVNNVTNNTLGASNGSLVASNSVINQLDGGAINASLNAITEGVRNAFTFGSSTANNSFVFSDSIADKSFLFSDNTVNRAFNNNANQNDRAFSFSEKAIEDSISISAKAFDANNDLAKFTINALADSSIQSAISAENVGVESIRGVNSSSDSTLKYMGIGVVLVVAFMAFGRK